MFLLHIGFSFSSCTWKQTSPTSAARITVHSLEDRVLSCLTCRRAHRLNLEKMDPNIRPTGTQPGFPDPSNAPIPHPPPRPDAPLPPPIFLGSTTNAPLQTDTSDSKPWDHLGENTHHGIIAGGIIGALIVICVSIWALRERRRRRHAALSLEAGTLPLYNLPAQPNIAHPATDGQRGAPENLAVSAPGGDAPPPTYEEVVPPHLRVATGPQMPHEREAEDGMIADGKTPLSEIPFEDVVLEPASSSSSSSSANQAFAAMHHNGMGDTRGHTNS
jgi:hypothetical protein